MLLPGLYIKGTDPYWILKIRMQLTQNLKNLSSMSFVLVVAQLLFASLKKVNQLKTNDRCLIQDLVSSGISITQNAH